MKLQSTLKALATALQPLPNRALRSSIAASLILHFTLYTLHSPAAEPLSWERTPNRPAPAQFDTFHGESLDFRCTFTGFGTLPFGQSSNPESSNPESSNPPIPQSSNDPNAPRLYYQTNGMGAAWWSLPATVSSNVLAATFPPSADPGAERLTVFFGAPSNAYAAAQVRFRNSPGATPNVLPPPVTIDWLSQLISATNALSIDLLASVASATNDLFKSFAPTITNKADIKRLAVVTNSIIVPERIDGGEWTHGNSFAGDQTGELVRDAALTASATDGSIYWSAQTEYTIAGEGDLQFYRYAIAWYNPYMEIFRAAVWSDQSEPMPSVVADIDPQSSDQAYDFRSVLGLPWPESFATLDTTEPDAVDWGDFVSIRLLATSTAYVPTQSIETVVYSLDLASATNDLHKSLAPIITNTVTKAFVEDLGVESGISASTATNIAQSALGEFANTGTVYNAQNADNATDAQSSIYANSAYSLEGTDGIGIRNADQIFTVLDESASTNYANTAAANAVANADTTYRRTIGVTNVNQSVQYVNITDTSPTTLAISMPTDGATKDWMVYVVSVTNVTLSLPAATWWMADTAYTNDVPPATPTAFWFSQVTDGIFILGRQELTEVTAP